MRFKKLLAVVTAAAMTLSTLSVSGIVSTSKTASAATFNDLNQSQIVSAMGAGWNLGNQLEAALNGTPCETNWGNPTINANLIKAVKKAGFTVTMNPDEADCLLLGGGGDVAPCLYGGVGTNARDVDIERDVNELYLIRKLLKTDRYVFGISRGEQIINVYFGGTRYNTLSSRHAYRGRDRLIFMVDYRGYISLGKVIFGQNKRAKAFAAVFGGNAFISCFVYNGFESQAGGFVGSYARAVHCGFGFAVCGKCGSRGYTKAASRYDCKS